jgi:hypothetical protein
MPAARMKSVFPYHFLDYSLWLKRARISFRAENQYFVVGKCTPNQSIRLYISARVADMDDLLSTVLPLLREKQTSFQLIKNSSLHFKLNGGYYSSKEIGKPIIIFPASVEDANQLAAQIHPLVSKFKGPPVFEPCIMVDDNFFATRALINNSNRRFFFLPGKRSWNPETNLFPGAKFSAINQEKKLLIGGHYISVRQLKYSPKGNVFKAVDLKNLTKGFCVLKQGRAWMGEDHAGRDIRERLRWEKNMLDNVRFELPVPRVIEIIEKKEETWLATEFIEGEPLHKRIEKVPTEQKFSSERNSLIKHFLDILRFVENLHSLGIVHRDLNDHNVMIRKDGTIAIIDFEIAYRVSDQFKIIPFFYGEPGFRAPEQDKHQWPTLKEDIYSLGAILFKMTTNIHPSEMNMGPRKQKEYSLQAKIEDKRIIDLILNCVDANPVRRPSAAQIIERIEFILSVGMKKEIPKEGPKTFNPVHAKVSPM